MPSWRGRPGPRDHGTQFLSATSGCPWSRGSSQRPGADAAAVPATLAPARRTSSDASRDLPSPWSCSRAGAAADAIVAPASLNVSAMPASAVSAGPTPEKAAPELQRTAANGPPSHHASGATAVPPRQSAPEQPRAYVPETGERRSGLLAPANTAVPLSAARWRRPAEAAPRVTPARVAPPPPSRPVEAAPPIAPGRVELTPPSPHRPARETAAAGSGGVHIGHLEVRIVPSPSPPTPARRATPRSSPARLARAFRNFGLAQV